MKIKINNLLHGIIEYEIDTEDKTISACFGDYKYIGDPAFIIGEPLYVKTEKGIIADGPILEIDETPPEGKTPESQPPYRKQRGYDILNEEIREGNKDKYQSVLDENKMDWYSNVCHIDLDNLKRSVFWFKDFGYGFDPKDIEIARRLVTQYDTKSIEYVNIGIDFFNHQRAIVVCNYKEGDEERYSADKVFETDYAFELPDYKDPLDSHGNYCSKYTIIHNRDKLFYNCFEIMNYIKNGDFKKMAGAQGFMGQLKIFVMEKLKNAHTATELCEIAIVLKDFLEKHEFSVDVKQSELYHSCCKIINTRGDRDLKWEDLSEFDYDAKISYIPDEPIPNPNFIKEDFDGFEQF